jgi:hypothetical protein
LIDSVVLDSWIDAFLFCQNKYTQHRFTDWILDGDICECALLLLLLVLGQCSLNAKLYSSSSMVLSSHRRAVGCRHAVAPFMFKSSSSPSPFYAFYYGASERAEEEKGARYILSRTASSYAQ